LLNHAWNHRPRTRLMLQVVYRFVDLAVVTLIFTAFVGG
jgi:hypothetical protein